MFKQSCRSKTQEWVWSNYWLLNYNDSWHEHQRTRHLQQQCSVLERKIRLNLWGLWKQESYHEWYLWILLNSHGSSWWFYFPKQEWKDRNSQLPRRNKVNRSFERLRWRNHFNGNCWKAYGRRDSKQHYLNLGRQLKKLETSRNVKKIRKEWRIFRRYQTYFYQL